MALQAGYKGIKKYIADKLNALGDLGELATDKEIAEATDKVRSDIAPVLEEAKAPTGGISAGDQFFLNDILYTASADIAAGANIVVTGDGKNADVSSNITAQLAEKADNSVIGPVENGATASQAYMIGEHFIRDGKFCTAIQSIASEATFTKDTNYVEGTLKDIIYKRYRKTVTISAGGSVSVDIPTISGYTPVSVISGTSITGSGVSANFISEVTVDSSSDALSKVLIRNSDSIDHSWPVRIFVIYVKSDSIVTELIS